MKAVRAVISACLLLSLVACDVEEESPENGSVDADASTVRPVIHKDASVEHPDASVAEPTSVLHEIKEGQTLWTIAVAYDTPVTDILTANGLTEDDVRRLSIGYKIKIPGASITQLVEVSPGNKGKKKVQGKASKDNPVILLRTAKQKRLAKQAAVKAKKLGLGTRACAGALLHGRVEKKWIRAAGGKKDRFPGTLMWPVKNGWFVRGYGSGKNGYHLAVDIGGDKGWNVRSSARGIVGYSGNELKGYGNIVMVIHPGGWVTMYAHNTFNTVVAGQRVRRGEVLAELGATGIAKGPHVHFEFMYDKKNCDPAFLFRPGVKHRSKKVAPLDKLVWKKRGAKPKGVKCQPRRSYPK